MNRQTFLKRLGSAGVIAMTPLTGVLAKTKIDPSAKKSPKEKIITEKEGKVLQILGNKQVHKLVGKDTNGHYVEWIDYLKPGAGIPPHIHTKEDEIFRVIEGEVELMVNHKTSILKAGDMAFAPKNIIHSWRVIGTNNAQMCVSAYPAGMEHMFDELHALPPGKPDFEKVAAISARHGIRFVV